MQIPITKTVNLNKLHDELIEAELIAVDAYFGADYFVAPEDVDTTAIQTMIDNHDPTPRAQPPTLEERQTDSENAIAALMDIQMQMMGGGM